MKNDEIKNKYPDPWDQSVYQIGSTNPPRKHSGLVAFLLIAVILLAGVASFLGVMNIQMFSALNEKTSKNVSMSLHSNIYEAHQPSASGTVPSIPAADMHLEIKDIPESETPNSTDGTLTLQQIYDGSIASVVSITCSSSAGGSSGTGVVLAENGYIVTNSHVVEDAQAITVLLSDDRTFRANLVGMDAVSDLAVLYVDAQDLSPAQFGDSDSLRVGDTVCAIGDPLGVELRGTMTNGIISAINRDITTNGRKMTLIQTNAALNSGNSGGPLINRYGQVIGINTMKIGDYMSSAGVEGLGFAIPSTTVVDIVSQLINQGYVSGRPSLGFAGEPISTLYQYYYRLPAGMFITEVAEGTNADMHGLTTGDILVSLDGKNVSTVEDLTTFLYDYQVGDTIEAVIYRSKQYHTITLIVEEAKG